MNDALRKKKKSRFLFISILGITPAAILGFFLSINLGTLLSVSDPLPSRLDVIFTFAGENQRVTYSRNLTNLFPDAHWLLSDYYHFFSHILKRDGFSMTRVSFLDTCTNTLSEVHGLKDWINSHRDGLKKPPDTGARKTTGIQKDHPLMIGLVSSPLHMRRIKIMTQTVFHDTTIHIYYLPVPLDQYHWSSQDITFWWRSKPIRNWVTSEIGKLLAFWFFS